MGILVAFLPDRPGRKLFHMARKRIRLGLIGCGGFMRNAHVPRYLDDGSVDLVGVCDPDRQQAEQVMQQWGQSIAYCADYRQMMSCAKLDAAAIASPHTPGAGQEAASYFGRVVSSPSSCPVIYSRAIIQKGKLGTLRGVVGYVTQDWLGNLGWRLVPKLSGGGMFIDTGSYLVAVILWLTGRMPLGVSAFSNRDGATVDVNTVVNVRFRGGAIGTLSTFGNAGRHDERIAVHGAKGCIVFHLHQ